MKSFTSSFNFEITKEESTKTTLEDIISKYIRPSLEEEGKEFEILNILCYKVFIGLNDSFSVDITLEYFYKTKTIEDFLKSKIHYTSKERESLKEANDFTKASVSHGKLLAYQETLDKLGETNE